MNSQIDKAIEWVDDSIKNCHFLMQTSNDINISYGIAALIAAKKKLISLKEEDQRSNEK